MDGELLSKTLAILKAHGVSRYVQGADGVIDVSFYAEHSPRVETPDHTIDAPVNEQSMPVDLRAENINNFDHILNWSGAPDQAAEYHSDGEVVDATGDVPLT